MLPHPLVWLHRPLVVVSLGVAQFAGMIVCLFIGDGGTVSSRLTPTIIVNIISLACNWSVTILHLCASIPDKMKDALVARFLMSSWIK